MAFSVAVDLFVRSLGAVNFVALLSFHVQMVALIGVEGLAPAQALVNSKWRRWRQRDGGDLDSRYQRWRLFLQWPCIFLFIGTSNRALNVVSYSGLLSSLLMCFDVCSPAMAIIFWLCYYSVRSVAGPFLGLQMHANVLETNFLYIIASPFVPFNPLPLCVMSSFLVFRVMFGGGVGKYQGGDSSWQDFTAMCYHYHTMPLPNPISYYMHRLPRWFHKIETVVTLVVEVPVALFMLSTNQSCRLIAVVANAVLLMGINITGNFGHLAAITLVEMIPSLNDDFWCSLYNFENCSVLTPLSRTGEVLSWLAWIPAMFYLGISIPPLVDTFHGSVPIPSRCASKISGILQKRPLSKVVALALLVYRLCDTWYIRAAGRYHVCNRYVKFGHMTKKRWEIIIEASQDGQIWHEIPFRYKPSHPKTRPPFIFLHMPCLDWRVWFLPNQIRRGVPNWFVRLLQGIQKGDLQITALLGECEGEFDANNPPPHIRAVLYDYQYAYVARDALRHDCDEGSGSGIGWRSGGEESGEEEDSRDRGWERGREKEREKVLRKKIRSAEASMPSDRAWYWRKSFQGVYYSVSPSLAPD